MPTRHRRPPLRRQACCVPGWPMSSARRSGCGWYRRPSARSRRIGSRPRPGKPPRAVNGSLRCQIHSSRTHPIRCWRDTRHIEGQGIVAQAHPADDGTDHGRVTDRLAGDRHRGVDEGQRRPAGLCAIGARRGQATCCAGRLCRATSNPVTFSVVLSVRSCGLLPTRWRTV